MIRLHIWLRWRIAMRWLYEAMHEPDSSWLDEWADELRAWNADPESLGGAYYKDGVLVRRTWAGLIRVDKAVA